MVLRTTDRRAAAEFNSFDKPGFVSIGIAPLSCGCPGDEATTARPAGVGLIPSGFFCDGFLLILARRPLSPDVTVPPLADAGAVSTFAKLETEADLPCRDLGIDRPRDAPGDAKPPCTTCGDVKGETCKLAEVCSKVGDPILIALFRVFFRDSLVDGVFCKAAVA